jgi:C1A family cysteine protease
MTVRRQSSRCGVIVVVGLLALGTLAAAGPAPPGQATVTEAEHGGRPCSMESSTGARASSLGVANPAALYCAALGYSFEIERTREGERGVCVLPNGERVDAWEFYRGKVGQEYSWCALNGYGIATRTVDHGTWVSEYAVCLNDRGEVVGTPAELMGLDATRAGGTAPRPAAERPARWGIDGPGRSDRARDLPTYFDWRDVDGCTSVKNQASCGSCWAFATVGPLECNIKIKDGVEVDLSEQWLVSCNQEGWGCGGGWWAHDYHLYSTDPCGDAGAVLEQYFPYTATDAPCNCPYPHDYFIEGWAYVPGGDIPSPDAIKEAILEYGPISVAIAVDSNFHDYDGGVFSLDTATEINHGVVLVGWDDSQGSEGVWFLRNSWGPGWGENGYMRIEYGCDLVGYGASYVDYRDPLRISLPDGAPGIVPAGEPTSFAVRIEEIGDTYVPDSGTLYYRYDGATWQTSPLAPTGGDLYEATLPAADCGDTPEFYVSAEGSNIGVVTDPQGAPDDAYSCFVGTFTTMFTDDFESDLGWSVQNDAGLTDGQWDRGVPAGGGDRGDPPTDYDGSGRCYLTDNVDGNSDVDGGTTWLLSPAIDVSDADQAVVTCAIWYTNDVGDNPNDDLFRIYLSDDNGTTWVLADSIGPNTPAPHGWYVHGVSVGDHVALTDQLRVRFAASDEGGGSVVEAGVDDFRVNLLSCENTGVSGETGGVRSYALYGNAPNPFNPQTLIRYDLPSETVVNLRIIDASGRVVRTLVDTEDKSPGTHSAWWDGTDQSGRRVASGTYFYRLEAGGELLSRKMVLLK